MCVFVYVRACMCDKYVVPVGVCLPPRSRCTVGNEGIRSGEQITLPEDNEIISHLQLLDEKGSSVCVCVCVCVCVLCVCVFAPA